MTKKNKILIGIGTVVTALFPLFAFAQTVPTDYTASISSTFAAFVNPLVNGSWHYLGIVVAIAAGFAIFYFAWHKFMGIVRR